MRVLRNGLVMRPRHYPGAGRSPLLLVLPVVATMALAAGCGGSSRPAAASATTTAPASGARSPAATAARAKFVSCLEAHGVPASEATRPFGFRRAPGAGSTSTSSPPTTSAAFAAAFRACRSDLPARRGGFGALKNTAAGRAYLQCLQLHGVTVPSTPSGTANGGSVPGGAFGAGSNPNFQAARTACAALAPHRTGGGTGPGSTTSTAAS